jgi:hypothetical protein
MARCIMCLHLFPMGEEVDVVMQWGIWFYPKGEKPTYGTRGEIQVASHHGPDWGTGIAQGSRRAHSTEWHGDDPGYPGPGQAMADP